LKAVIIKTLHLILGYHRYLKIFSVFKISTLKLDSRKSDFLFFETLLDENANVLVVGACTGITTIPLAKNNSKRKIFAYEPLVSNFRALNKVIAHYGLTNITTFNLGLGNKAEEKEIILPIIKGVKKQGMAHIKDPSISGYEKGEPELIRLDSLDNRAELKQIKIAGIKVVAENFELPIFEGAETLIRKNNPVIYCELWDNEKREPVMKLIRSYGYVICYRERNNLVPYTKNSYGGKNFFFKPAHE
jgi:FkbM family methyltransferase